MLTRNEGERLANSIHALRPDWPVASLLTIIERRHQRPFLDLALELTYVALDPESKSPARIDVDGPWKRLQHSAVEGPKYRVIGDDDCSICTRPKAAHPLSSDDRHVWEPQHARAQSHRPTAEQRAAINAANDAARKAAATPKDPAQKRTPRDVDEVLASHASTTSTEGQPA